MTFRSGVAQLRHLYGEKKLSIERRQSWAMFAVLRPISFWISVPFLRYSVSANAVTVLSWPLLILATVLLAMGGRTPLALAGLLYLLIYILDLVDGNIARFRSSRTYLGKFLDGTTDTIKYPLLYLGLAIGVDRAEHDLALGWWVQRHVAADAWLIAAALLGFLRLLDAQTAARLDLGIRTIALHRLASGRIDGSAALSVGRAPPAKGLAALPRRLRRVESELEVLAWVSLTALGRPDLLLLGSAALGGAVASLQILRHLARARVELRYPRP